MTTESPGFLKYRFSHCRNSESTCFKQYSNRVRSRLRALESGHMAELPCPSLASFTGQAHRDPVALSLVLLDPQLADSPGYTKRTPFPEFSLLIQEQGQTRGPSTGQTQRERRTAGRRGPMAGQDCACIRKQGLESESSFITWLCVLIGQTQLHAVFLGVTFSWCQEGLASPKEPKEAAPCPA